MKIICTQIRICNDKQLINLTICSLGCDIETVGSAIAKRSSFFSLI